MQMGNAFQKKEHKVFGIIAYCLQSNQYLMTKNKSGNFWEFPKGYPEKRDNSEGMKTALREFEEETGISQNVLKIIPTTNCLSFKYLRHGKVDKEATYFLGILNEKPKNVKIQHSEVADYAWESYNEALQKLTYENCKNILIEANQEIVKFLDQTK